MMVLNTLYTLMNAVYFWMAYPGLGILQELHKHHKKYVFFSSLFFELTAEHPLSPLSSPLTHS